MTDDDVMDCFPVIGGLGSVHTLTDGKPGKKARREPIGFVIHPDRERPKPVARSKPQGRARRPQKARKK